LKVRFEYDSNGVVGPVETIEDSLHAPEVESCVHSVLRSIAFAPSSKAAVQVAYPFSFSSDGKMSSRKK
jgi:hypothetical protein